MRWGGAEVGAGGRLIKHARYDWLLRADNNLTRRLFGCLPVEDCDDASGTSGIAEAMAASRSSADRPGDGRVSLKIGRKGAGPLLWLAKAADLIPGGALGPPYRRNAPQRVRPERTCDSVRENAAVETEIPARSGKILARDP